ncbi:MAG TPA: phosphoribosyl-ATP diphosphatase [Verrucomicrobiae bacterium]|nr:phosphoribosyl-ATP diphosphatase [Verrucomicrobiae bacterium]
MDARILSDLYAVILERKANPADNSYTASLLAKGLDKILKKVGEESAEVIIAGKGGTPQELVCESADLLYHLLVLLACREVDVQEVFGELGKRFGISGIEEKSSRTMA